MRGGLNLVFVDIRLNFRCSLDSVLSIIVAVVIVDMA